jgi:hypothetical protein
MKLAGITTAVVLCVSALVVVNAPGASASLSGMNLYQDSNYGGGTHRFSGNDIEFNGDVWSNGQSMQNSASSMQNFTSSYVGLWDIGTSCTGASYVAKPSSQDASFSNNNFNDKASCLKFI